VLGMYNTPDLQNGARFEAKTTSNGVEILTDGKTKFSIPKEAFKAALRYLIEHKHLVRESACEINASQSDPGPLNAATRRFTADRMNISYLLPILASTGLVGIDGIRKNKTWINLEIKSCS
ncbi:MAG: hypothetical protein ORN83_15175, partial [Chthoniobacteraceae bacterium]|nr:hypothetical protein [Chthoniobacteraceae bacterium]